MHEAANGPLITMNSSMTGQQSIMGVNDRNLAHNSSNKKRCHLLKLIGKKKVIKEEFSAMKHRSITKIRLAGFRIIPEDYGLKLFGPVHIICPTK